MSELSEVTNLHVLWAAGEARRARLVEPLPLERSADASPAAEADVVVTEECPAAPAEPGSEGPLAGDQVASSSAADPGTPMATVVSGGFGVETTMLDSRAVLRLIGELDVDTAEHFANAARLVHAKGIPTLVVDLSELEFIDSTGLGEFVVAHQRQCEIGGGVVLRAPSDRVRRVLDIVGLDQVLTIS